MVSKGIQSSKPGGTIIVAVSLTMFSVGMLLFLLQNSEAVFGRASAKTSWKENWKATEVYYTKRQAPDPTIAGGVVSIVWEKGTRPEGTTSKICIGQSASYARTATGGTAAAIVTEWEVTGTVK